MKQQSIVFIGSNTTGSGVMFFEKCVKLGFQPLFLRHDAASSKRIADAVPETRSMITNIDDYDEVKKAVAELGQDFDIRGVVSSSEYYVETAAKLARSLGLPGVNPDAIRLCRNKKTQRDALQNAEISQPRYATFRSKSEFRKLFADPVFQKGAIVKPTCGSGSVGVYFLSNADDFDSIESQLQKDAAVTRTNWEFLLEEFVEGDEFSVEIFNGRSFGVTRKYLSQSPRFLEVGHDFPANSSLSYSTLTALQIAAEKSAAALRLTQGPVHVELKALPDGTIRIIEINPRLAGGSLPRLFELVGFDAVQATLQGAAGLQVVPWIKTPYRCASIRFLLPPKSGILHNIIVKKIDDDSEIAYYKQLGERVDKTGDFRERIGHVVAFGVEETSTRERADALVNSASIAIA